MRAQDTTLLEFIANARQFVIPIFQRHYSWTATQCKQLWDDVNRSGAPEAPDAGHFVGSVVYVERGLSNITNKEGVLVIDGQQRLTTTLLLLKAISNYLEDKGIEEEILGEFSPAKIRHYYLSNPAESGEKRHKLLLSETDKETLIAVIDDAPLPPDPSRRIIENYQLFVDLLQQPSTDIEVVCRGLARLKIVDVALDRDQDNPQLIFESMNSTGLALSQADLIRNYVLMGLDIRTQEDLYRRYWRPMENTFGQEAYTEHFDRFMRHYLTVKTGEIPRISDVYIEFKRYAQLNKQPIEDLVADVHAFSNHYAALTLGQESSSLLKAAFTDINTLRMEVVYPFLLEIYDDYRRGQLSEEQTHRIARLIESYLLRRTICGIPTNVLNKFFATFARRLNKEEYVESLEAILWLQTASLRFPRNDEFVESLVSRDIYNYRNLNYLLSKLEHYGEKERRSLDHLTVEHILPQNPKLPPDWQESLGPEWEALQGQWVHTLGNLTLTGYNSEYRDYPFKYKRDLVQNKEGRKIGLAHSRLLLNEDLDQFEQWNIDAIQARASRLAKIAEQMWELPDVTDEILQRYRLKRTSASATLEDHLNLRKPAIRALFDTVRTEVLALNPRIQERIFKVGIVYRLHSNFFDIEAQSRRLKISLYIPYDEIDDARGITRDVTTKNNIRNRDTEVMLNNIEELPHVLDLIKQALAFQVKQNS